MTNKTVPYSIFVLYSEKQKEYVKKTEWYNKTDCFTKDPTKARIYTKKGHATNSLNQTGLTTKGFLVYERKISSYSEHLAEKDPLVSKLQEEIDRLRQELSFLGKTQQPIAVKFSEAP